MSKEKQILVVVSVFFVCVTLALLYVTWKGSSVAVVEVYDTKSEPPVSTLPAPSPLSPAPVLGSPPASPIVLPHEPTPTSPKPTAKPCVVSGCSSQICGEESMMSTCEFREEYACYQKANCERQNDGACGWTMTDTLKACLGAGGQNI